MSLQLDRGFFDLGVFKWKGVQRNDMQWRRTPRTPYFCMGVL
jgi:hypothetical protein